MIFSFLDDSINVEEIVAKIQPYFTAVCSLLLVALVAFTVFKVIILAKDLSAAGDDPQRRSEIKKAFMYTLIAPLIGIMASTLIIVVVNIIKNNVSGGLK